LGSSFGLKVADIEHAYHEHGVNYLYWGSVRRPGFGRGIRNLAQGHRDDLVVVLQSYSRMASLMGPSVRVALRRLKLDYADVLLLGLFNKRPAQRLIDAALKLKERGLVRFVGISGHNRPLFQRHIEEGLFDFFHVRYNAAHRGAEKEIFPFLPESDTPGLVAFTATRWGTLLKKDVPAEGDKRPDASDCYRFCLTHPSVDVVISGSANRQQLDEALRTLSRGPLDSDELDWMRRVGDRLYEKYRLRQKLHG
jgi:predicted aldo/keto reductase-like oxidoreductase